MKRYEYKIVRYASSNLTESEQLLNKLGQDGWLIVHLSRNVGEYRIAHFVREIQESH